MKAINAEGIKSSLTDDGSIADTVNALIEIVEDQQKRIDELEDRLDDEQTQRGKDDAELRGRITNAENRLDAVEEEESTTETPTDGEKDSSTGTQTPLEQICSLPEEAVVSQLSANQRRARFVARDVEQYASKVPAGYAITSGEISTVLRAGTDCDGRTQTVARVMDFLDRLGGGDVKIVKRRGTKRIVFDEEIVKKLGKVEKQRDNTGCYDTIGVGV
jgi:dissimilatory sulfite reductase (desulfoviridin) alpha/beta subunit